MGKRTEEERFGGEDRQSEGERDMEGMDGDRKGGIGEELVERSRIAEGGEGNRGEQSF